MIPQLQRQGGMLAFLCLLLVVSSNAFLLQIPYPSRLSRGRVVLGERENAASLLQASGKEGESPVRVRFAPSPTGVLHVGGARTALYNWLLAKNRGGDSKFIVRVEDTDESRSSKESEEAILKDLKWFGLTWDEGPDVGGPQSPYRQSERTEIYKTMASRLLESGNAYPCFLTEEELEEQRQRALKEGRPARFDTWRNADPEEVKKRIERGDPYVVRFKVERGRVVSISDIVRGRVSWDCDSTVGDFVVVRSNGMPVYNFCVAVDDALMGITHVLRAEEHLTNTVKQLLVLEALGFPAPRYAHCSLILGEDRQKLSKRHGAASVGDFQRAGFLPSAMVNYLATLGWNDGTAKEIYSESELCSAFDVSRLVPSAAVFDMQKLRWMNLQHLRLLSDDEFRSVVGQALDAAGTPHDEALLGIACALLRDNLEIAGEAPSELEKWCSYDLEGTLASGEAAPLLSDDFASFAREVIADFESGDLPRAADFLGEGGEVRMEDFKSAYSSWVKGLGKRLGRKGKRLFHPARLALSGKMSGPEVFQQLLLAEAACRCGVAGSCSLSERIQRLKEVLEAGSALSPPPTGETVGSAAAA
uniref:glutamate--tRNA ligase n=1 Tax=Chromera velia CCMP2878 TaxID=1169474 RepID=A0A0G4HU32_9ALVE|eukprot:Cvel_31597.t1-p1 / transcript=Cvel_31597.t1 / gene=Cvel_31597 / organism=Chromera_velia_CCMP2878 / gene_product=Glutamate--tRNA ligase, chloroplastic/mitochondrial, putative / transcript_product=Glutamate--tRNA ligase, chloroplastic/mitochondrial, putative / location=Cvel_scaffold4739:1632-6794(+) / protein_length=588 / sequence_SO=supercontig / SO=protein_coding / is_pseudo=false